MVLYAGPGTRATIDIARKLEEENLSYAPVSLLPGWQKGHNMVLLSDDLIREIPPETT